MLDRTAAPKFIAPKKFKLPRPEITKLNNGSRFFFLNAGEQPVIKLEFIFKSGIWYESAPGVAFFTGKMLLEGTRSFDSREIAEKLDQYGAFVNVSPGFDYTNLSIHIPVRHFHKIQTIIKELLFYPSFPEHELDLMQKIQLQQLKVNEQKNKFVASRLFRERLFCHSPYGNILTKESVEKITVAELKRHYEKYMQGKFDIFITGNFDGAFQNNVTDFFGENMIVFPVMKKADIDASTYFDEYVERKGSLQSSIFIGKKCISRDHKDFGSLLLLNEVFGGYFGARLMQNIREEKGLTYSIYSHPVAMKNDAYFVISTDVKKEKRDVVVNEIHHEIEKISKEKIGSKELQQAKNHLKGSILNTLTTPFALTEKLKKIYFFDLGLDYYGKLFDKIDHTTSSQLMHLANEQLFNLPLSKAMVG